MGGVLHGLRPGAPGFHQRQKGRCGSQIAIQPGRPAGLRSRSQGVAGGDAFLAGPLRPRACLGAGAQPESFHLRRDRALRGPAPDRGPARGRMSRGESSPGQGRKRNSPLRTGFRVRRGLFCLAGTAASSAPGRGHGSLKPVFAALPQRQEHDDADAHRDAEQVGLEAQERGPAENYPLHCGRTPD